MTQLCAKLNIEKGSLTSMIDDLTKKGYVYREKDLADRRKYMIVITEEGEKLAINFTSKLSDELEQKLYKLDESDRLRYQEALETLQYILNKEEVQLLAEIAKEKDLWIIADEVNREL
ncbi:MarR family winged helix-turn-helix transcriptional regulator, partial [Clostridium perfringens]|uniref:MarR family winged helix-turn-helix transcriptional regulator n=1 Tax=Clostridium perfringens TaxID=1502 RepID=UPI002ACC2ABB